MAACFTATEWPCALADGDVLVVRQESVDGLRFMVHSRRRPQFSCRTYAEAEGHALAYADRACMHAWYHDGHRLQLVSRIVAPSPTVGQTRHGIR
jgi:hypothetical protein